MSVRFRIAAEDGRKSAQRVEAALGKGLLMDKCRNSASCVERGVKPETIKVPMKYCAETVPNPWMLRW